MRQSSSVSRKDLQKFKPVAPRVFREEPLRIRQGIILSNFYGPDQQRFTKLVQIGHGECRMRLLGGMKRSFDADVNLLLAALEPTTSARAERRRFLDFRQAQNRSIELTSRGFAALWSGQLNVIDTNNHWIHLALSARIWRRGPSLNSSRRGSRGAHHLRGREKPPKLRGALAGTFARSP